MMLSDARGTESETEVRQPRMIVRATAERPAEQAVAFADRHFIDACVTMRHQAVVVELPVLVTVRAEPRVRIVVKLVRKAHRDTVAGERPQLLDQSIVEFALPFATQQFDNRVAAGDE